MKRPKLDKVYYFIRIENGRIEIATVQRRKPENGGVFCGHGEIGMQMAEPGAWKSVLEYLRSQRFTELEEARAAGLVPKDWQPTG